MTSKVIINDVAFEVKVAQTAREQARGLMETLEPCVMAFPYLEPKVAKFWMKNTPTPLDIVFCRQGKIVDVCQGLPYNEERLGPNEACDLVVEFPSPMVSKCGWKIGNSIELRYSLEDLAQRYILQFAESR